MRARYRFDLAFARIAGGALAALATGLAAGQSGDSLWRSAVAGGIAALVVDLDAWRRSQAPEETE